MTKKKLIEEFLKTPLKIGDTVSVQGLSSRNPTQWSWATVSYIDGDECIVSTDNQHEKRKLSEIERVTDHIGVDLFVPRIFVTGFSVDITGLLHHTGWKFTPARANDGVEKMEERMDMNIPEVCYNPIVLNETGEEVEFQRGLVWNLEQKQLLIESIYHNIEIGKVVLRARKFDWVTKRIKTGKTKNTGFFDLVDGKQRATTIVSFIKGEFCDLHGNYWDDMSASAKRKFLGFKGLTLIKLDEDTTDKMVLEAFLAINFTGVPMSKEHIKFVQSIKI